jgi:hypothetical protein
MPSTAKSLIHKNLRSIIWTWSFLTLMPFLIYTLISLIMYKSKLSAFSGFPNWTVGLCMEHQPPPPECIYSNIELSLECFLIYSTASLSMIIFIYFALASNNSTFAISSKNQAFFELITIIILNPSRRYSNFYTVISSSILSASFSVFFDFINVYTFWCYRNKLKKKQKVWKKI